MIHLPASVRVYLCLTACDMRKSFDGLHQLVRDYLQMDAFAGHLFVSPAGGVIASRSCTGIATDSRYGASAWKKGPTRCHWRAAPRSNGGRLRRRSWGPC